MFSTNVKKADKLIRLRCKQVGTKLTLRWQEWPNGKPTTDATTGALIATEEQAPVQKTCDTKAFTHFVSPTQSTSRIYAEIQTGDCIVDFVAELVRVDDPGGSDLESGQVLDVYAFNKAARLNPDNPPTRIADDVNPEDLENLSILINGEVWIQKGIGKELQKSWLAIYGDTVLGRAILLRKAM